MTPTSEPRSAQPVASREALASLRSGLVRLARTVSADAHAAEEIADQAILKFTEHYRSEAIVLAKPFVPAAAVRAVRALLKRICWNVAIDGLRRRRPSVGGVDDDLVLDDGGEPVDLSVVEEDAERVRGALDRLPAAHRRVLFLRYYAGLEHGDIAALLGCRIGAARVRLLRAHRALERALTGRAPRANGGDAHA